MKLLMLLALLVSSLSSHANQMPEMCWVVTEADAAVVNQLEPLDPRTYPIKAFVQCAIQDSASEASCGTLKRTAFAECGESNVRKVLIHYLRLTETPKQITFKVKLK